MRNETLESLGWGDLIRRLASNIASIVDLQIELVKEEARENISQTLRGAAILLVGAFLLLTAWISFIVAGILALARLMDDWLAAATVGIVFAIVGAVLTALGRARLTVRPLEKTRESLTEDIGWIKRHTTSSGR